MPLELDALHQDALCEMLNIGMGQAAASLSQMAGDEVRLSVPTVEFPSLSELSARVSEAMGDRISAVRERFHGLFQGDALLIFSARESLNMVRAFLHEDLPLEMLSELEQEALTEVGNVILNACLGSLAALFQQELHCEIPDFMQGGCSEVLTCVGSSEPDLDEAAVLLLRMDFALDEMDINGFVTLLMGVESLQILKENIDEQLGLTAVAG